MTRYLHEDFERLTSQYTGDDTVPVDVADAVVARGERHQRVRRAVWGVGSAAVVAGLALGLVGLPDDDVDQTPATPTPSPPTPDGGAVIVNFDASRGVQDQGFVQGSQFDMCGDAPPEPGTNTDGISITSLVTELSTDPAAGTYDPRTEGHPFVPTLELSSDVDRGAVMVTLNYLLVTDDEVVGVMTAYEPFEDDRLTATLNASEPLDVGSRYFWHVDSCGAWDGTDYEGLPEGDYLAYPMIHVASSKVIAAAHLLENVSGDIYGGAGGPLPEHDSRDCRDAREYRLYVPISCLDGFDYDPDDRTVDVSVPAGVYLGDLEATLVGDPVPFAWEDPWDEQDYEEPPEPVNWPTEPACGDYYSADASRPALLDVHTWDETGLLAPLAAGEQVVIDVDVPRNSKGTVRQMEPAQAWLVIPHSDEWGYEIAGSAQLIIHDGEWFDTDYEAGPSSVTMQLANIEWCDGAPDDIDQLTVRSLVNKMEYTDGGVSSRPFIEFYVYD